MQSYDEDFGIYFKTGRERGVHGDTRSRPPPTSVNDCFEKVFKSEVENTSSMYRIVEMSMAEKDGASWNFMQWFVKEQTEEETLAIDLMDKIKIAGGEKVSDSALYAFNRDLETKPDQAVLAQAVTAENP